MKKTPLTFADLIKDQMELNQLILTSLDRAEYRIKRLEKVNFFRGLFGLFVFLLGISVMSKAKGKIVDLGLDVVDAGLFARKLWNALFPIYNERGDLTNFDSFLCDLADFQSYFGLAIRNRKNFVIYWNVNGFWTEIYEYQNQESVKIEFMWLEKTISIEE